MIRQWLAERLRYAADRIDRASAPKCMSYRFTFEEGEGIKFRDDGRGCLLWYLGDDEYDKAFSEADRQPPRIDWATMTLKPPA